jgi:probable HAF family extracellular repeat protein
MKPRNLMCITAMTLFTLLAIPARIVGQDNQDHNQKRHRYKLIDLGTFGGPQSYLPPIGTGVLNNQGVVAGSADTPTPDPFPAFCFNPDCFVSHAFQTQNGVLTDLGALPGGASSASTWISANGLIAGLSENGLIDPLVAGFPEVRAVLWRDGAIVDLGTLEGGYESVANSVNNRSQVVGIATNTVPDPFSMVGTGYQTRAFLWQNGAMQDLGTLGGPDASAFWVNDRGQIAGASYTSSTPNPDNGIFCPPNVPTQHSFLWDKGAMIDLPTLGGTCSGPGAINSHGQVAGGSSLAGNTSAHPYLWDRGVLTDLGTLGGSIGFTNWINDVGEVVGGAYLPGDLVAHAFLWKNGMMTDLGTVGADPCSTGFQNSSKGQVVGGSGPCTGPGGHAFLWEHGGPMIDLNTLIPPNSDLQLTQAYFINDHGEITGLGTLPNGDQHVFVLIPCDENHPGLEVCDYSLADTTELPQILASPGALSRRSGLPFLLPQTQFPFRNLILGRTLAKRGIAGEVAAGQPRSQHTASPQAPIVMLQPASLNFGTVIYGQSSTMTTKLTNVGSSLLTISAINIGGTGASAFSQTNTCGGMVGVGGSCLITVTFKPQGIYLQKFSARVRVVDNASGSPQHVPLFGNGSPNCNFSCSKCPPRICFCGFPGVCQPAGGPPEESERNLLDDPKPRPACSNATQSFHLAAPN